MVKPLIWQRMLSVRPTRNLKYGEIVRVAMEIADKEGLTGVSMRSVAGKLKAGTMSLYRYVTGKDELLDLLLDAAYGEIRLPSMPSGDWQRDVARVARETRRVLKGHPWLAPLVTARPTLGPNYLGWFEFLLAATAKPGRDMRTQVRMVGTVWAYVTGFVGYEIGEMETTRRHGLTEKRKRELAAPYVEQLLATGKFPNLARFLDAGGHEPTEEAFQFGLEAVLAGIGLHQADTIELMARA